MDFFRIVETCNNDSDSAEQFATPYRFRMDEAHTLAKAFNQTLNPTGQGDRYWKVVRDGYVLSEGFQP